MLSPDEPVRVFHDEMKKRMDLHDMIVVGVVNEHDPASRPLKGWQNQAGYQAWMRQPSQKTPPSASSPPQLKNLAASFQTMS